MGSWISKLIRWPIYGTFLLVGLSVAMGRWMGPELERRRLRGSSPSSLVCDSGEGRQEVLFLDGDLRCLTSMRMPEGETLEAAGLSPWEDGWGHAEVAGLWLSSSGEGNDRVRVAFGLARVRYPDGEILNRVPTETLPGGPPCWVDATGDEIVFASGVGQLCRFAFTGSTDPRSSDGCDVEPTVLMWDVEVPGAISDLTRPVGTGCEGLYLASVRREQGGRGTEFGQSEIWWLRMDAKATRVVGAGRLTRTTESEELCERYPVLGRDRSGSPQLAYLSKGRGVSDWSLRLTEVVFSPASSRPIEVKGLSREVATGCVGSPAAFGGDGRVTYLMPTKSDEGGPEYRVAGVGLEEAVEVASRP